MTRDSFWHKMSKTRAFFAAIARHDVLLLFLFLSAYFLFLLPDIRLPGINDDEALEGICAVDIPRGEPAPARRFSFACCNPSICISVPGSGGRLLPIMQDAYESYLPAYLLIPFAFLFGVNLYSLRLMSVTLSFFTLIYLYLLLREWFGRRIAFAALVLIISNPVFVIYHKLASSVNEVYLACFFWAGLYHLYRYYAGARRGHLVAAAFCVGLGLDKITFLWYIAGFLLAGAVLCKRLARKNPIKPKDLLFAIPAFCVGNCFMLYYNLRNGFETVAFMFRNLVKPTHYGGHNLDFLVNLKIRLHHLVDAMLNGRRIGKGVGGDDSFSPNALIFAAAIIFLMFFARRMEPQRRKKITFLAVVFAAVYMCSHFTVSTLKTEHLYALYFLPPILTVAALFFLKEVMSYKRTAVCLAGILMAVMLTSNIAGAAYDIRDLRKTGGRGRCSTAIPALACWLDEHRITGPVIAYELTPTIPFLTENRVKVIDRDDPEPGEFSALLADMLSSGADIYFVTAENINDFINKKEFDEFLSSASRRGREISVVKVFNNRAGRPEFVLHRIAQRK